MEHDKFYIQKHIFEEGKTIPSTLKSEGADYFETVHTVGGNVYIGDELKEIPALFSDEELTQLNQTQFSPELLDMEMLISREDLQRRMMDEDTSDIIMEDVRMMSGEGGMTLDKEAIDDVFLRREKLSVVRSSYQLHTFSASAKKERDRVIRDMAAKKSLKEQLLQSEQSLEYIVDTFISNAEKKRVAKVTKDHLKHFWKLKESITKDPLLSSTEKARILYNYAKSFASDVEVFKTLYVSELSKGKREEKLETYIQKFEDLITYFESGETETGLLDSLGLTTENANTEMFGAGDGSVLKKARAKARRIDSHTKPKKAQADADDGDEDERRIARNRALDDSLTREQLIAVARADDWLVSLGINSEKRLPFINRIMALSARERLFMYRMIETGHLTAPNIVEMGVSQTSYIPDVTRISWKMFRVPFRLWEKISKDGMVRHHWDMLETALEVIGRPEVADAIDHYAASIGRDQEMKALKEGMDPDRDPDLEAVESIEDEETRKLAREVYDLNKRRENKLETAIAAVEECQKALEERDSAWIKTKKRAKIAGEATEKAIKELNELFYADAAVNKKLTTLKYKTGYTKEDLKGELTEHGLYLTNQALGFVSKLSKVPTIWKTEIATAGLTAKAMGTTATYMGMDVNNMLVGINASAGAFASAKSILGLVGSLKGIQKTTTAILSGDIAVTDSIFMGTQALYGLGASATGLGLGITSIAYASKSAQALLYNMPELVSSMKTGVTATSAVLSGAGLVMNMADYTVQGLNAIRHIRSTRRIKELKSRGELVGDDAGYLDGIAKLDTRNKTKKAIGTTFSMVTNIGNLASLFAGPEAALIWAGLSVGISMVNKLTDYLLSERSKKKTAEEFLQMNDISDLLQDVDKTTASIIQSDKKKMKDLKAALMDHMAAEIGFTTFKTFFTHIVGKYAAFLYQKLFYDGGKPIMKGDEKSHGISQACYQMVKGLGLRVKFPKSDDEQTAARQRHPSIRLIAAKLGG